jgi:hypothetical protein
MRILFLDVLMRMGYLRTETNFLVQKKEGVVLHVFQV